MSFPGVQTGKKILRKKKEMTRVKEKITFLCVQTGMQISRNKIEKNQEIENKKKNEGKNSP